MSLTERITSDLRDAMKAGDRNRIEALRSIRAAILEFEKRRVGAVLTDADELDILTQAAKRRREAIEQFDNAGRTELVAQERAELEVISAYLPAQMSDDEIEAVIRHRMSEAGVDSMAGLGKVMGPAMKELKGRADGAHVQALVRKLLGGE